RFFVTNLYISLNNQSTVPSFTGFMGYTQ
ncbi:hypothetical protein GCK32_011394, partial [Trichostrongylus colubriformis]